MYAELQHIPWSMSMTGRGTDTILLDTAPSESEMENLGKCDFTQSHPANRGQLFTKY